MWIRNNPTEDLQGHGFVTVVHLGRGGKYDQTDIPKYAKPPPNFCPQQTEGTEPPKPPGSEGGRGSAGWLPGATPRRSVTTASTGQCQCCSHRLPGWEALATLSLNADTPRSPPRSQEPPEGTGRCSAHRRRVEEHVQAAGLSRVSFIKNRPPRPSPAPAEGSFPSTVSRTGGMVRVGDPSVFPTEDEVRPSPGRGGSRPAGARSEWYTAAQTPVHLTVARHATWGRRRSRCSRPWAFGQVHKEMPRAPPAASWASPDSRALNS